jgi:hypothetical protein
MKLAKANLSPTSPEAAKTSAIQVPVRPRIASLCGALSKVVMVVLLAVVAFWAMLGTAQAQTNLVKNGSFENTVIETWKINRCTKHFITPA